MTGDKNGVVKRADTVITNPGLNPAFVTNYVALEDLFNLSETSTPHL